MTTLRCETFGHNNMSIEKGKKYYYIREVGYTNLQKFDDKVRITEKEMKQLLRLELCAYALKIMEIIRGVKW